MALAYGKPLDYLKIFCNAYIYLFARYMENCKYLIDSRFLAEPQVNSVKDLQAGVEHHLEPRIMEVLSALLKKPGVLITRETLIREIWNNYAGAEEGLTQAISSLRKILGDDAKDVIRTVPKKGYIMMAPVVQQNHLTTTAPRRSRRAMIYIATTGLIVIAGFFFFTFNRSKEPAPSSSEGRQGTVEVTFPGMEEIETNYLNTITTTDLSNNRYRLTMIGDRRPKFYVNDILHTNTEPYAALIDKLAKELWKRKKEDEGQRNMEVTFPGVEEAQETDYFNTITTTDSAGIRYRLVMIGDRRPKFYLNDTLQTNMEAYTTLIDKLAKELWKRQKEERGEMKN